MRIVFVQIITKILKNLIFNECYIRKISVFPFKRVPQANFNIYNLQFLFLNYFNLLFLIAFLAILGSFNLVGAISLLFTSCISSESLDAFLEVYVVITLNTS